MAKRKREVLANDKVAPQPVALATNAINAVNAILPLPPKSNVEQPARSRGQRKRNLSTKIDADPQTNPDIRDAPSALRASPDADSKEEEFQVEKATTKKTGEAKPVSSPSWVKREIESESSLSDLSDVEGRLSVQNGNKKKQGKPAAALAKASEEVTHDPEAEDNDEADPQELKDALARPPPVNSPYLPLPWKGRLGYACLNTYLRTSTPPVFSSRTCRIASILEHRHPLKDPTEPEHATKNRPDKTQPADVARGQAYVEALGVANAQDIPKMLRWNEKYGIKFLRLSSEMFPFASHDLYGYKLAPFAAEALGEAGRVAAELGHRLTTHPGQFTQLGSPRKEVIVASFRDLEYHCELLSLLKLPPQQDRDAVMILHMGGIFGDKAATIERFKENYSKLSPEIKARLVLENDDVCYSVHDLLPVCEELNIPLVLDYHHHNIVFDSDKIREGTLDIMGLYDRIKATWDRKGITQKMHYSEPCPDAITPRQRRKHNPRVYTLPPCADNMDLMIEAKDKEQAVFELMRILKLPGFEKFNAVVPHMRTDENKVWKPTKKKTPKKRKGRSEIKDEEDEVAEEETKPPPPVAEDEVGMGGPDGRVYWPPGMEEWLRPKKREVKPRDPEKAKSTAEKAAQRRAEKAAWQAAREASAEVGDTASASASATASENGDAPALDMAASKSVYDKANASTKTNTKTKTTIAKSKPARAPRATKGKTGDKPTGRKGAVPTPSTSDTEAASEEADDDDNDDGNDDDVEMPDLTDTEEKVVPVKKAPSRAKAPQVSRRASGRAAGRKAVNYAEEE